jgi:hypothetical protein
MPRSVTEQEVYDVIYLEYAYGYFPPKHKIMGIFYLFWFVSENVNCLGKTPHERGDLILALYMVQGLTYKEYLDQNQFKQRFGR